MHVALGFIGAVYLALQLPVGVLAGRRLRRPE